MAASGLDHVNILTDDLEATASFYEQVLELKRGISPAQAMGLDGAWMIDPSGNAIVHLLANAPGLRLAAGRTPGQSTNAVHHVAFRCTGFAGTQERLTALGLEYQVNDGMAGLRQIMVQDPNAVSVEMNFTGE
jgi:catechol 2,3-dioxygenase-like lactoylglutathione lyase family enzyme